jgi:hypothetical protein
MLWGRVLRSRTVPKRYLRRQPPKGQVRKRDLRAARQLLRRTVLHRDLCQQPVLPTRARLRTVMLRARAELRRSGQGHLPGGKDPLSRFQFALPNAASDWPVHRNMLSERDPMLRRKMLSKGATVLLPRRSRSGMLHFRRRELRLTCQQFSP